jgi:hypothetical protein
MDTWLLRRCNLTSCENIPALLNAQEPSTIAAPVRPEADNPSEARSHVQYVEMVNFLYGFATTLG